MQRKTFTHLAGFSYFLVVLTGIFSLMYVPNELVNNAAPAITTDNIRKNLFLFRLDIVANIVCYLAFMVLPLLLYQVLRPVHKIMAQAMVLLALMSIPISLNSIAHKLDILDLLTDPALSRLFDGASITSQVFFHLKQFNNGITIVSTFWGLWLFPFGLLVYKSGFLPKLLGVLLIAGTIGYIINLFGGILVLNYYELGLSSYFSLPASLGEIGTCFWLLIMGDRKGFVTNQR
jgi:hypothetical protein